MANITIKANGSALRRMVQKAAKAHKLMNSSGGLVFKYIGKITSDYYTAVVSGIGTFSAGGAASGTLSSNDFSFDINWEPLSAQAQANKQASGSFTFWESTGAVKNAIKVDTKFPTAFAGIDSSAGEAFEHALKTEFGGAVASALDGEVYHDWPARGLFTMATAAFMERKEAIYEGIRESVYATFKSAGWGS